MFTYRSKTRSGTAPLLSPHYGKWYLPEIKEKTWKHET